MRLFKDPWISLKTKLESLNSSRIFVILVEYLLDWIRTVDFSLIANFWASPIFHYPYFKYLVFFWGAQTEKSWNFEFKVRISYWRNLPTFCMSSSSFRRVLIIHVVKALYLMTKTRKWRSPLHGGNFSQIFLLKEESLIGIANEKAQSPLNDFFL